jgi:hypothetical protein
MAKIKLGKNETLVFDTVLTPPQIAKFKTLADKLIIIGASAYLRLDELHGALFTNSKQAAKDLVMNHMDIVKPYLVTDKVLLAPFKIQSAIKPIGLYLLMEYLAEVNPKKAIHYKAGLSLLALILSNHPQILIASMGAIQELDQKIQAVMKKLKQDHQLCQLTGVAFKADESKHVHHIECAALNPGLVAEPSNLVVVHEWVHTEYHHWAVQNKLPVCRSTLGLYAVKKGFSTPFVNSLKAC